RAHDRAEHPHPAYLPGEWVHEPEGVRGFSGVAFGRGDVDAARGHEFLSVPDSVSIVWENRREGYGLWAYEQPHVRPAPAGARGQGSPRKPTYPGGVKEPNGEELRSTAPPPERKPAPAARPRLRPRHVWKVASTPRMLGFALVIIVAAVACVKLGTWQLDRAVAKAEQAEAAGLHARLEAPPEPLDEVVAPQPQFVQSMVGQRVEASGELEGPEFFVPRKFRPDPADPKNKDLWTHGYWILTPLRTDEGAILPVVRGWVEHDDPAYLNAEGIEVQVIGALDGTDPAEEGVSGNHISTVSTGQLANIWDGA